MRTLPALLLLLTSARAGEDEAAHRLDMRRAYLEKAREAGEWERFLLFAGPSDPCGKVRVELREDASDLTRWFDGRICCDQRAGRCEFSLRLPSGSRGACPDSRVRYRLCWTAGYEFDQLSVPVERGRARGIWRRVHDHYLKWRWCDDGSASEAMSAFLVDLLANHWRETPDFFDSARRDERFFAWVLGRLDGLVGSRSTFARIAESTRRSCPRGGTALCARLRDAALKAAASADEP